MAAIKRSKGNRGARVAPSASQYSVNVSYSNRAKAHGSPASCVSKFEYDYQLKSIDGSRVDFTYISASSVHSVIVKNPIQFVRACEATAGRQANSRQMKHVMVALPGEDLSDSGRERLVIAICDLVREFFEGQPVFGAVHCPSSGEENYHLHLSHGLRNIQMRSPTEYTLGERIMSEQRPKIRLAAGLSPTNHSELRALRAQIAELIANALAEERVDPHRVERWRCGHLSLSKQVRCAEGRGDHVFARDHIWRDPTDHEGYGGSNRSERWAETQMKLLKQYGNAFPSPAVGAKSLTIEVVALVLRLAKQRGIRRFAHLRMLALDHDLIIRRTRHKRKNGTQGAEAGLSYQLIGGPIFLGRKIEFTLHHVCRVLGISQSEFVARQNKSDIVDSYLLNFSAQPDELRNKFEGRLIATVLLHMMVRKADLDAQVAQEPKFNQSQEMNSLAATIDRSDLKGLVEELSRPLIGSERDDRDLLILRDLDLDDDLRTYVHRMRGISMNFDHDLAPDVDSNGVGEDFPDESNSVFTDQQSSELIVPDRRARQRLSS